MARGKRGRLTVTVSVRELGAYHGRVLEGELERGELSRRVRALLHELAGPLPPEEPDPRQTVIAAAVRCPECGGAHPASLCDAEEPDQATTRERR